MSDARPSPLPTAERRARNARRTLAACVGAVALMVGLAYAAVPLYGIFCKVTGYGGTPRVAEANTSEATSRIVTVRLDANVSPALAWRFEPETPAVRAHLGETTTVFFRLTNTGRRTTTGIASFNVLPELSGGYFNKIQCFCFSDITLEPGQSIDAPVVFYVDPKIDADQDIKGTPEITLSYSFFPSKGAQRPVAAAKDGAGLPAEQPRL
jgi:cytochrome c oxidase assembly protein subunit 11